MVPFSLKCERCNNYMGKGTKVNAKKEMCIGEDYMGIRVFRFYFKCIVCSQQITFKTDPRNADYICESGAKRNYESYFYSMKDKERAEIEAAEQKEEEEKEDAMTTLESRTTNSKLEMDVMDALDEIKATNQRHERVDTDMVLQRALNRSSGAAAAINEGGLTADEEEELRRARFKKGGGRPVRAQDNSPSDSDSDADEKATMTTAKETAVLGPLMTAKATKPTPGLGAVKILGRKRKLDAGAKPTAVPPMSEAQPAKEDAMAALGGYGSSDSD